MRSTFANNGRDAAVDDANADDDRDDDHDGTGADTGTGGSNGVASRSMSQSNRSLLSGSTAMSTASNFSSAFGGANGVGNGDGVDVGATSRSGRTDSLTMSEDAERLRRQWHQRQRWDQPHHHHHHQQAEPPQARWPGEGDGDQDGGGGGAFDYFGGYADDVYSGSPQYYHHRPSRLSSAPAGAATTAALRRHRSNYVYTVGSHQHYHTYGTSPPLLSPTPGPLHSDDVVARRLHREGAFGVHPEEVDAAAAAAGGAGAGAGGGSGSGRGGVVGDDDYGDDEDLGTDPGEPPGAGSHDDICDGVFSLELL